MKFRYGDELRATVSAPLLDDAPYLAVNLVNDYGLEEHGTAGGATHDNQVICGCCPDAQKILK